MAERIDAGPILDGIGFGDARLLGDARHRHRMVERHLARIDAAADRGGAGGVGRAGERDMALPGKQPRGRVEADPTGARQVHFRPGMEVREIGGGSALAALVGRQLDEIAGDEARGETEVAGDLHQQPGAVAARAGAEPQRVLARLDARLEPDDIADAPLHQSIERNQEVHGSRPAPVDIGEKPGERRTGGFGLEIGSELAGERRLVDEGIGLGVLLQEEVEGVDGRHLGDEIDLEPELLRRLGKDVARQVVRLRILLPVEKVMLGRDLEGIAEDRRAAVRRRPQPHGLRPQTHRPVVAIGRRMRQRDVNGHAYPRSVVTRRRPRQGEGQ
jgi:hypothetical protein